MRIILYHLFLLFLATNVATAQNDRLYTMFVFNKLQYNPAYAGSADALNVGAHYRHQWQGIEGAPRTVTAFAHAPIIGGRSGVGLSLISDEIGIFNTTYAKIDYAYRITFKNESKLSLGINAQFDFTRFDWTKADLIDNVDAAIPFGTPSNSLLVSYVPNAPKEIDFNLSFLFLESFWIGGSYRLHESIDAFVQFPISQQLKVAVGVDYALTELNSSTKGSFEVMIEYLFKYDNEKINNIRFF